MDMNAGNWYRVWTLDADIIITDDDKLRYHKVPCATADEANLVARKIVLELTMGSKSLWDAIGVTAEALSDDMRSYEAKRMAWYRIA